MIKISNANITQNKMNRSKMNQDNNSQKSPSNSFVNLHMKANFKSLAKSSANHFAQKSRHSSHSVFSGVTSPT